MAAGATYTPLATTTLGSAAGAISFTNIPQTYTDLVIVGYVNCITTSTNMIARWGNGSYDSGTNYSVTTLYGRSTDNIAGSERASNVNYARVNANTYLPSATSTFGSIVINLNNYSNTTTYKTAISQSSGVGATDYAGTETTAVLWRSTAAINQIEFYLGSGTVNFQTGSKITIYGVTAA